MGGIHQLSSSLELFLKYRRLGIIMRHAAVDVHVPFIRLLQAPKHFVIGSPFRSILLLVPLFVALHV